MVYSALNKTMPHFQLSLKTDIQRQKKIKGSQTSHCVRSVPFFANREPTLN